VRFVKVSTPSENVKDVGLIEASDRLAPSVVATVNDPVMYSLVVNGAETAVKAFPVYVYTAPALARGVQNAAQIRTPGPMAGRIRFLRWKTRLMRIAMTDMWGTFLPPISIRWLGVRKIAVLKLQVPGWSPGCA